jgi:hypothetical protein
MRSRLRSTAAKKMSFSVVMLIASFGALMVETMIDTYAHWLRQNFTGLPVV